MLDLNTDDDRLRSLAPARPLGGFGRLADEDATYAVAYDGIDPVAYETLNYATPAASTGDDLSDQGGASLPANAVPVVQTMTASTGVASLDLPKFDFATGVASCTSCASATSNAVATNVKHTPLPEAPQTFNWLLWATAAGVAYFAFKGPDKDKGLGCPADAPAPAPAPAPMLSGLPPRHKEPKPTKHVASLKIS